MYTWHVVYIYIPNIDLWYFAMRKNQNMYRRFRNALLYDLFRITQSLLGKGGNDTGVPVDCLYTVVFSRWQWDIGQNYPHIKHKGVNILRVRIEGCFTIQLTLCIDKQINRCQDFFKYLWLNNLWFRININLTRLIRYKVSIHMI